MDDADITDIADKKSGPIECCMLMLNTWQRQEGNSATVKKLASKLRNLKLDEVAGKCFVQCIEYYNIFHF